MCLYPYQYDKIRTRIKWKNIIETLENKRFIYEHNNRYRYLDAYAKQVYYKRNGDNSDFDYYEGLKKQNYEGYLREEEAKKARIDKYCVDKYNEELKKLNKHTDGMTQREYDSRVKELQKEYRV